MQPFSRHLYVVEMMRKQSRAPEIVADAAYVIINQPSIKFSGNFCIDDQILAHQGLVNLDRYAATPGSTEFQEGKNVCPLLYSLSSFRWLY